MNFFDFLLNVKKKEIQKNNHFISFIEKKFNIDDYDQIYDLCCGKSIISAYFSLKKKHVYAIDKKENNKRNKLIKHLDDKYYTFTNTDIYKLDFLEKNSLILSLHACGNLTDKVIELAIQSQNDFAVMSCCHDDKQYFTPKKMPNINLVNELGRDNYADLIRLNYVIEQEYNSKIFEIPKEITPKNRIIWGENNLKNNV